MLNDELKTQILNAAGPISFGRLQTVSIFLKRAKKSGLTMDDIITYVEDEQARKASAVMDFRKERERRVALIKEKSPLCPLCGDMLRLFPVRDTNPNGYQSRWACTTGWQTDDPDKICGYEQLNTESYQDIYKRMGIVKSSPPAARLSSDEPACGET